jgi:hypothetical protein
MSWALLDDKTYFRFLPKEVTISKQHIMEGAVSVLNCFINLEGEDYYNGKQNPVSYYLSTVRACCGMLFLSEVLTLSVYKKDHTCVARQPHHKYGQLAVALAIAQAEVYGYSSLTCVVASDHSSDKMIHILEKFGFVELKEFKVRNHRTGNTLRQFQKKLSKYQNIKGEIDSIPPKLLEQLANATT